MEIMKKKEKEKGKRGREKIDGGNNKQGNIKGEKEDKRKEEGGTEGKEEDT